MGILHLRPRAPSHALPSTAASLIHSRSSTFLPGRKMQTGTARLRLVSRCTADGAFEPSPEEDNRTSRFDDEVAEFEKKYGDGTILRALRARALSPSPQYAKIQKVEATLFRDEAVKLRSYVTEIVAKPIILNDRAGALADMLCLKVSVAIRLCVWVTANAHLRVPASSEMSSSTFKQIIRTYVWRFLKTAEDACHGKVDRTVVISFIDALSGLAAISHILFEDTLSVVNNVEDSSSCYSPEYDVEALNHELQRKIKESVTSLTARQRDTPERLQYTLNVAERIFEFVTLITHIRRKALDHFQARGRDE